MPVTAILVLAAGTYAFRITGPLLHDRLRLSAGLTRVLDAATVVLLVALVAAAGFTAGDGFAGWARTAGVVLAGALVWRRAPLPIIVLAAAGATALLRLVGVG